MMGLSYWLYLLLAWCVVEFSVHVNCFSSECVLPFPRSYVVYHLSEQESIEIDGKLDEKAWEHVSWTEDFIGDYIVSSASWRGRGGGSVSWRGAGRCILEG